MRVHTQPGSQGWSRIPPLPRRFACLSLCMSLCLTGCLSPRLSQVRPAPDEGRGYFITGSRVFDGQKFLPPQDVVISDQRIAAMGPAGTLQPPPGSLKLAGAGLTLLPGLTDMHVHLTLVGAAPWSFYLYPARALAQSFLYAGVTRILVATGTDAETRLSAQEKEGRRLLPQLLPQLFVAGPGITAPLGHPIPLMQELSPDLLKNAIPGMIPQAATPDEARAQVRAIHTKYHPPFLKLFFDALPPDAPHLSKEALEAAVQEAKTLGMRPIAHVGSCNDMVTAAEAGVSLLMHVAYSDELKADQLERLRELKVPFVPTLRIYSAIRENLEGTFSPLELEMMPGSVVAGLKSRPASYQPKRLGSMEPHFPEYTEHARNNAWRMIEAGIPYYVGTDTGIPGIFPGAGLHSEIDALATLGLKPEQLLNRLTRAGAQFLHNRPENEGMGKDSPEGCVAVGCQADLILVKGNPQENLSTLHQLQEVFVKGQRLSRRHP